MLSTPTPARPTTRRRGAADRSAGASTCDRLRTIHASTRPRAVRSSRMTLASRRSRARPGSARPSLTRTLEEGESWVTEVRKRKEGAVHRPSLHSLEAFRILYPCAAVALARRCVARGYRTPSRRPLRGPFRGEDEQTQWAEQEECQPGRESA